MNVVDSSGWLEYFAGGKNAKFFAPVIENTSLLIVPSLSLFEVFKRVMHLRDEQSALQAVSLMHQGRVVDLDATIALEAARISLHEHLPMADSVILSTARAFDATLWTQDADFKGVAGVKYVAG